MIWRIRWFGVILMVNVMEWKGDFPRIDVLMEKAEGLSIDIVHRIIRTVKRRKIFIIAHFIVDKGGLLTSRLPVGFEFYFRSACSDRKGDHLVRIILRILIAVAH